MSKKGGLEYIAKQQLDDGGFLAYEVARPDKSYHTTFVPSLIGLALHDVAGSEKIQQTIAQFLLGQKSHDWSWNYWDRASDHVRRTPYPDDLDDTCVALAHLWHCDPSLFTPTMMAKVVNLLFVTETKTGGPYITWIVDEKADKAWRDVDVIVNSNIASFLSLQGVALPNIETLIVKAIDENKLISPYYPGLLPGTYLLSRWYKGDRVDALVELLLAKRRSGIWTNPHQTALAVSALIRLGYPFQKLKKAVDYIIKTQQRDGSWPFDAMYIVDVEYGSPALTTAICLEALALYEQASKRSQQPKKVVPSKKNNEYNSVVDDVRAAIRLLSEPDLRVHTARILDAIVAQDLNHEIVLLPWLVRDATKLKVSPTVLHNLATVSLWGWMAYTTYDDFLDNEGDPRLLPSAVFAMRQMHATLQTTMADNVAFQSEVRDILDRLDGANAWEVSHCRGVLSGNILKIKKLPDYEDLRQLADRSLGHTIAGIGVLYAAGIAQDSYEMNALRRYFRHYLIARQLNDDAHDWEEDLAMGHINAVAVLILRIWAHGRGRDLAKGIDLKRQGDALRKIMWEEVINETCQQIRDHVQLAKSALDQGEIPFDTSQLFALLTPLEMAADAALKSRDEALEFIEKLG